MDRLWIWVAYSFAVILGWLAGLHDAYHALLVLQALDIFTGMLVAWKTSTFRSAVGKAGIQRRIAAWVLIAAIAVVQTYTGLLPAPGDAKGMGVAEWAAVGMAFMEFTSVVENANMLGVSVPDWLLAAMDKAKTVLGLTPREPREGGK